jgi:hypothetical protein
MTTQGVEQHVQNTEVEQHIVYPDHPNRGSASSLFRKTHDILVKEMNLPCFKCFMKHEEVPPEAYENRQVHHYLIEWAKWNAAKGESIQKALDMGFYDPYGFAKKMKGQPFISPDDIRNMMVLCQKHHTGSGTGIHHTEGPEWTSDLFTKEGVDLLLDKEQWKLLCEDKAEIGENGEFIVKDSE